MIPGLFYGTVIAIFYLLFGRRVEHRPWPDAVRRALLFGLLAGATYAVMQAVLASAGPAGIGLVLVVGLIGILGWWVLRAVRRQS